MKNARYIVWVLLIILVAFYTTKQQEAQTSVKPSTAQTVTIPRTTEPVTVHPNKEATPPSMQSTQEAADCLECGSAESIYDGYCYYCHPDFMFLCVRCGCLWPAHRTPSEMCDLCIEDVKNGAPKNLNRKKVVTETCIECGDAPGEYDGYCYYCHPDFLFLCKKCGCLWPAHRKPSGLCDYCEGAS